MPKIYWDLEEAIALVDLYLRNGATPNVPGKKLARLSCLYDYRAQKLGIPADSKFRNLPGLKMQLACIHCVVTGGKEGMCNAGQVFYQAWILYQTEPERFSQLLNEFYQNYDELGQVGKIGFTAAERDVSMAGEDCAKDSFFIREEATEVNSALAVAVEDFVRSFPDGVTRTELGQYFAQYQNRQVRSAIQKADIIPVLDKYFHRDNIEFFEPMADTLREILIRQFDAFGDYTSGVQLYTEARPKLDDFFFYNGAFDSCAEVYELAAYLFGKSNYKNQTFIFKDNRHIWRIEPDYSMDYGGLLQKYAREHGNMFSRDEATEFFRFHGSSAPAQTLSLILNRSGKQTFLQYAENRFVIAEALDMGDSFLSQLGSRIEVLLDGDDYVVLGDVSDYFYSTLPNLPPGVIWNPILLKSVLERFDVGFITIDAGYSNGRKMAAVALVRKNSPFKTFGDVVWSELNLDYQLPKTMTGEEFRQYLLRKGFIHGTKKADAVHKAVKNDLRFYWMDGHNKVTVSKS